MYDPKEILTESGYRKFLMHIENIREAMFFLQNHADDLGYEGLDDEDYYKIFRMDDLLNKLENGPFE